MELEIKEDNEEYIEKAINVLQAIVPDGTVINDDKFSEVINVLCGTIILFIINTVGKDDYKPILRQCIHMLTVNIDEKLKEE